MPSVLGRARRGARLFLCTTISVLVALESIPLAFDRPREQPAQRLVARAPRRARSLRRFAHPGLSKPPLWAPSLEPVREGRYRREEGEAEVLRHRGAVRARVAWGAWGWAIFYFKAGALAYCKCLLFLLCPATGARRQCNSLSWLHSAYMEACTAAIAILVVSLKLGGSDQLSSAQFILNPLWVKTTTCIHARGSAG